MPDLRRCNKCKRKKLPSEFSRSKNKSAWCRSCCSKNAKKWRVANIERARAFDRDRQNRQRTPEGKEWARFYRWLTRHGLRPDDYGALFEAQGGKCAICKARPQPGKFLHIDHDHKTGLVRGLLCRGCNMGLGCFQDNTSSLYEAVDYVTKYQDGENTAGRPITPGPSRH